MVIYEMLKNGDYDRHVTKFRNVLKEKWDYILNVFEQGVGQCEQKSFYFIF